MFEAKQLTEHGKIYLEAANLLEKKGWCQKNSSDDKDQVCMGEALVRASYGTEGPVSASYFDPDWTKFYPVRDALTKFLGQDVVNWNDAPGRTKAEVIEKLREAAYNP